MAEQDVTCHPEFQTVASRYRSAVRHGRRAAIDRAHANLNRLKRELAQAEAWRKAAEQAFTIPNASPRSIDLIAWTDAEAAREPLPSLASVLVKLERDGERIELAVVDAPHVISFNNRTNETSRVLVHVFVPGQGMRVLKMTAPTFESLKSLRGEIAFKRRLVSIEQSGKPYDPEASYRFGAGERISPELAAEIAAAQLQDLSQITQRRTASAGRKRPTPRIPHVHKGPTPDRRNV